MGQLARGIEWPADESGVALCALSLDEAARLLREVEGEIEGDHAAASDTPISFSAISFETGSFETGSFETGSFDAAPFEAGSFEAGSFDQLSLEAATFEDASFESSHDDDPPTQRCPRWDPIAKAPSSPADDAAPVDLTPRGAPPFVRSLLTVW